MVDHLPIVVEPTGEVDDDRRQVTVNQQRVRRVDAPDPLARCAGPVGAVRHLPRVDEPVEQTRECVLSEATAEEQQRVVGYDRVGVALTVSAHDLGEVVGDGDQLYSGPGGGGREDGEVMERRDVHRLVEREQQRRPAGVGAPGSAVFRGHDRVDGERAVGRERSLFLGCDAEVEAVGVAVEELVSVESAPLHTLRDAGVLVGLHRSQCRRPHGTDITVGAVRAEVGIGADGVGIIRGRQRVPHVVRVW